MNGSLRLYVSAHPAELRTVRESVRQFLAAMNAEMVTADDGDGAGAPPSPEQVQERMAGCDAVAHFAGMCCGPVREAGPDAEAVTFGQSEVAMARTLGKPLYVYVCSERYPFDSSCDHEDERKKELQTTHRAEMARAPETQCRLGLPAHLESELDRLRPRLERLRSKRKVVRSAPKRGAFKWVLKFAALLALSAVVGATWAWMQKEDSSRTLEALVELSARPETDMPRTLANRWELAIADFASNTDTDTASVEQHVERFIQRTRQNPDSPALHKALAAYAAGEPQEAQSHAEAAAQILAESENQEIEGYRSALHNAWRLAGDAATAASNYRAALQHYETAAQQTDQFTSPQLWSPTRHRIGEMLRMLGRLETARAVFSEVLDERKTRLGEENDATLSAASSLIGILMQDVQDDTAWNVAGALVKGSEKRWGEHHPKTASALILQARSASNGGRLREAQALVERALRIDRKALGAAHPNTIRDQCTAAILEAGLRLPTAEEALRKAAQEAEQTLGPLHPQVLAAKGALAVHLLQLSRAGEVVEVQTALLQDTIKLYGEAHPSTANAAINLCTAMMTHNQFKPEEMKAALDQAERLAGRIFDEDHPGRVNLLTMRSRLASPAETEALLRRAMELVEKRTSARQDDLPGVLNSLGILMCDQKRFDEAALLLRRAQKLAEANPRVPRRQWSLSLSHLARLYADQGRLVEAESTFREALNIEKAVSGADDANTLSLMSSLASAMDNLGKHADAEKLMREALAARERKGGKDDPGIVALLNNLGRNLQNQGRNEESEGLYRRALAILEAQATPNLAEKSTLEGHLGLALKALGKLDEAAIFLRRAVATSEQIPGGDDAGLVTRLNYLGNFLQETGRHDEGEPLLQRALTLGESKLGADHASVINVLGILAIVKAKQGKYVEAEAMQRRAMVACEHTFGREHVISAREKQNLSGMVARLGRLDEALTLSQEALAITQKLMGTDHADTARQMSYVAGMLSHVNRHAEAEALARRGVEIRKKLLGPQHLDVAESLTALGNILQHLQKLPESEQSFREALDITAQVLGYEHPKTAMCISHLASAQNSQNKLEEAEKGYRAAIAILESTDLNYEGSDLASIYSDLGNVLDFKGTYLEAEDAKRKALQHYERVLGKEHPIVARVTLYLGISIKRQGRFAEAEPLYRRSLEILEKIHGVGHGETADSIAFLGGLYMAQKQYPEAIKLYRRALEIEEKYRGPSSVVVSRDLANLASMLPPQEAHPLIKRAMIIHARHRMKNGTNDIHAAVGMDIYLEILKKLRYTRAQAEAEWKALEAEAAREP